MSETCAAAIDINQDYCSRCSICYSIRPYEAMTRDSETSEVEIDLQKCQVPLNLAAMEDKPNV